LEAGGVWWAGGAVKEVGWENELSSF